MEDQLGRKPSRVWLSYLKTVIRWCLIALDGLHSVGGVHTGMPFPPSSLLLFLTKYHSNSLYI